MVKVQYSISRSKGQAGELSSSLWERLEIVQPAPQWRNEWAFNTQLAFSPNTVVETLISAFWPPNSLPLHPSWASFDKHPLYTNVVDGYGYDLYLHVISQAAAYGGITDQAERGATLQESFPLTMWDAHQSVRLCSYWNKFPLKRKLASWSMI